MEPEQRDEPDDPPLNWKQHRVDEPRNSWTTVGNVIGVILVAGLIIYGLAVVGVVVMFYIGMSHFGSNK